MKNVSGNNIDCNYRYCVVTDIDLFSYLTFQKTGSYITVSESDISLLCIVYQDASRLSGSADADKEFISTTKTELIMSQIIGKYYAAHCLLTH